MKFYTVVARPSLLYGSETWITTKRGMTRLEAAEMRFLRSVAGYTRVDKIRSEVIRKELEISGIQDVRLKYKKTGSTTLKEWTTPDSRNTPSTTNSGKERSRTPQERMAMRQCRNRSNDLIHAGR